MLISYWNSDVCSSDLLGAVERKRQRFEIASEIDAVDKLCGHRGASTPVKSRSRATKTLMLVPCRTLSVGGICVAGIVAFPPGKKPGRAMTTDSPAEHAGDLPPTSLAAVTKEPADRPDKTTENRPVGAR